jgi:hypothetical protein
LISSRLGFFCEEILVSHPVLEARARFGVAATAPHARGAGDAKWVVPWRADLLVGAKALLARSTEDALQVTLHFG